MEMVLVPPSLVKLKVVGVAVNTDTCGATAAFCKTVKVISLLESCCLNFNTKVLWEVVVFLATVTVTVLPLFVADIPEEAL